MNISKLTKIFFTAMVLVTFSPSTQISAEEYCEMEYYPDSCGGFQIYGEFLYWKAVQEQMAFAAVIPGGILPIIEGISEASEIGALVIAEKLRQYETFFKYQPGFKLGIGYQTPCNDWDFQLIWTCLHEKISSCVLDEAGGVFPLTVPVSIVFGIIEASESESGIADLAFATQARTRWNFEFDTLDFEIGKSFSFCNCVALRPFVGLKAASIQQTQNNEYLGFVLSNKSINVVTKKKNNFRGIGPCLGFDAFWGFYPNWNLTSSLAGALVCGKFDLAEHPMAFQTPNSIGIDFKTSKNCRIRPMVDMAIGIDWSMSVYDNVNMLLGVSYEAQYWWNQWQLSDSVVGGIITGGTSPQGDLMMQGVTVELGFSF